MRRWVRTWASRQAWAGALLAEAPLIVLAGSYVAVIVLWSALGENHRPVILFQSEWPYIYVLLAVALAPLVLLGLLRRGHSMRNVSTWVRFAHVVTPRSLLRWAVGCSLFWPFLDAFGWIKSRIPHVSDYPWDPAFARLDAVLHFGVQPWELLTALLPTPSMVRAIDWFYGPGFAVGMLSVLFWTAIAERDYARRQQILLTYLLIWIVLGSVLAVFFASVGPCYYGLWVAGPDPFAPLMSELYAVHANSPLIAIGSQEKLWAGFTAQTLPLGVSAMPSVHVGIAAWVALALRRTRLAIPGAVFMLLTLIGSVRLGWHYAVDGYVSILAVVPMWYFSGRFARWYADRLERRAPSFAASRDRRPELPVSSGVSA